MSPIRGACLCGAVAFEVRSEPSAIELCQCRKCRRAYGTAFAATLYARLGGFRWTRGEDRIRTWDAPLERKPPPYRHVFCRDCGSPLPIVQEALDLVEIPAGALEGDPGVAPEYRMFASQQLPWLEWPDDLPSYPEGAPLARRVARRLF